MLFRFQRFAVLLPQRSFAGQPISRSRANICNSLTWGGGLVAAITLQHQLQARRKRRVFCDDCCIISLSVGVVVLVAGSTVWSLQRRTRMQEAATSEFERRLAAAFNSASTGRAVLAEIPFVHPKLLNFMRASEEDIHDSSLAAAQYIRDTWTTVLSECYRRPKYFFEDGASVRGSSQRSLSTGNVGIIRTASTIKVSHDGSGGYKIAIPLLRNSDTAVRMGVDVLAEVLDRDGDGEIDFHEFATMIFLQTDFGGEQKGYPKRPKGEILKMLYAVLDDDGDAKVVRSEFESFLVMASKFGLCEVNDPTQFRALWERYDQDGNGLLSYEEFLVFARELLDLSQFPGEFPSH